MNIRRFSCWLSQRSPFSQRVISEKQRRAAAGSTDGGGERSQAGCAGGVKVQLAMAMLLFIVALAGCVNLKAVHDFAAISTEGQTLHSVAAELADSPRRQMRYTSNDAARRDLALSVEIGKTNAQDLVAAHGVIQAYMAAIANLASDGIVASNNAIVGFNKELANAKIFSDQADTRDAFGQLANLAQKAATDFYRRAELRDMIRKARDAFPVAIGALQRVVTNECVMVLQAELGSLNQYYREQSGVLDASTPKWGAVLVEEVRQTRATVVENKIKLCKQYGVVLGKIADGHAAMVKNLDHLDAKQLVSMLEGYQQQITAAYDAFNKIQ